MSAVTVESKLQPAQCEGQYSETLPPSKENHWMEVPVPPTRAGHVYEDHPYSF